tara:strand:+ start:86095 stop:86988 length:894 start_codon:yes stop_codon:yes gene_type:complete
MPITLGLWPVAGVTTIGVTPQDARSTVAAAIECGITRFDTAFSYGYDGESDRLLGQFVAQDRDKYFIIGKVGQRWSGDHQRVVDGSPQTLSSDAETSLRRIGIEQFDLLMLHSPDPNVPIEKSAETIDQLRQRGLCRTTGVCNVDSQQRAQFASVCRCDAIQCPLNMLQQENLEQLIPQCHQDGGEVHVFWTLMKGLLAGKITRDHVFAPGDSRPNYPIFQGEQRRRTHDILDRLSEIAQDERLTIAQLSIGWALAQDGVTSALVGARRPQQIKETAKTRRLDSETVHRIDQVLATT